MITINKILVPTDFSDGSVPGIAYALSLAKDHHAELTVVHVLPTDAIKDQISQGFGEGLAASTATPSTGLMEDVFERKKQLVRAFVEQRLGGLAKAVTFKPAIRYGKVVEEIIAAAKEEKCDLIVMASRGSRLSSLFRGRVSERVARHAPCPFLVIQPSAEITTENNERVPVTLLEKWAA